MEDAWNGPFQQGPRLQGKKDIKSELSRSYGWTMAIVNGPEAIKNESDQYRGITPPKL